MDDEWLSTMIGLMAQIVIDVYSKEKTNCQDILINPEVIKDEVSEKLEPLLDWNIYH